MKYFAVIVLFIACTGCKQAHRGSTRISSPARNAESVYLTNDHKGNPVVAWTEKSDSEVVLSFAVSSDDGRTFSESVSVVLQPSVATHAEGMPKVAFKRDGTIIVAYEKKTPTKENKYAGAIGYMASQDGGKTWSPERYIHSDTVAGRSRSYFDIQILPDGEVGASWLDIKLDQQTGGRSVMFARTDETNNFSQQVLVDSSACQCCRIDVNTDASGYVYVAYRGLRNGRMGSSIRDMMVATSSDNGQSFSSPLAISADNWNIDGCPHTGPSLCSNKAGLITMWYTEGNGKGIFYSHKSQQGEKFRERELVSGAGRHPQVCASGDKIAMLWDENLESGGRLVTNVKYKLLKDGVAVESSRLTPMDVNGFLPVVTKTTNGFLVAYLMEIDNGIGVYLMRL